MGFQAEKELVRELFEQLIGSTELTVEKIFENFVSDDYVFKGTNFFPPLFYLFHTIMVNFMMGALNFL